ncbi:hypothetical protein NDA15_000433 [Ustilago hordei]|nr:hypothetical protein NDA15_000433 [Ustilago hordei]
MAMDPAQAKPPRPRATLGLKRALPCALASSSFASPSRVLLQSSTPVKRARLVLPTQPFDQDGDADPVPSPADASNETPPSHAFLLARNSSDQATTASVSPSEHSPAAAAGPFYLCTWRKPQAKKHKTWDGDAILVLKDRGERCSLICSETGKELVASARFPFNQLSSGDQLALGGKEVEIDRQIDQREYRKLTAFTRGELSPVKKTPPPTAVRTPKPFAVPIKPSAIRRPVDINQFAPARVETFYGKPARSPIAKSLDDHPTDSRSANPSRPSGLVDPGQGKTPHPRFDPNDPDAIVMKRPDAAHQKKYNTKGHPIVDVVLDPQLAKALRPHQVQGVKFLYERVMGMHANSDKGRGCILADQMGLGKTLQTIALILTLAKQNCYYTSRSATIHRALVVCPLTLVKNWKREFRKWIGNNALNVLSIDQDRGRKDVERFARSSSYNVMVIGYEKLRTVIEIVKHANPPVDLIVCDEGHRLKNKEAQITTIFDDLSFCNRRIILSGTPIQNHLSELHALVSFVDDEALGTYDEFRRIFEEPIIRSRAPHCSRQIQATGQARAAALKRLTNDVILRRTADILVDFLPPKKEMVLFCSPSQEQLRIYQSILASNHVRSILQGEPGNGLLQIGVLRKLCNTPELLLKDCESSGQTPTKALLGHLGSFFPPNFVRNEARYSGKLICLMNLLETVRAQTEDKVVLVSSFTSTLDTVEAMVRKKRYSYLRLDGKTPQDERMAMVNQFNRQAVDKSFVFLLSAKSGGVGLNLIGANRLVLIDSDWNPSTDLQAMARIHRDGQNKVCYIYRLLLSGTMDEKIYQRQISKLGLSDSLMDSEKKSASDTFSQQELKDIFTLHLDSACISHRQLVCDCDGKGGSASPARLSQVHSSMPSASQSSITSSDDDQDEQLPGFIAASQHVLDQAAKEKLHNRNKLLALYKWAHYDCTRHPDAFSEDDILAQLIRKRHPDTFPSAAVEMLAIKAEKQNDDENDDDEEEEEEWSRSMREPSDDHSFSHRSDDGAHHAKAKVLEALDGFQLDKVEPGRILFVFSKTSDRTRHETVTPFEATTGRGID